MAHTPLSLILIGIASLLLLSSLQTLAQSSTAPAPSPLAPINITAILEKGGQFTTFIRLITSTTQVANQINNQVNTSSDGMTVFAPTDNAFANLPAGTINDLTDNQQVQLVLYHVLPKYYSIPSLLTVSNPVRTQATGNGGVYGLNFTGQGSQVNVSTGVVVTQVNNPLRQQSPLAVYTVDKVLLPMEFTEALAPAATPPAANTTVGGTNSPTTGAADSPSSDSGRMSVGLGLVGGMMGLFCMGLELF